MDRTVESFALQVSGIAAIRNLVTRASRKQKI
jgi:hypothetical protein